MFLGSLIAWPAGVRSAAPDETEDQKLRQDRFEIRAEESAALEALAGRFEAEGQRAKAAAVRSLIEPTPPVDGPSRFEPLPEIVHEPLEDDEDDRAIRSDDEVAAIRDRAADRYEELSDRAFDAGRLALADLCLREVLRRRPDDPEARRILGYVPHDRGWATPHAVQRLKNGDVPHPIFGWVPGDWVPKLEEGLLPAPSRTARAAPRWVPAEDADAARQGAIANGWQITTPHFKIQASVPLDEGIDFARRLEAFHDLFTSVLADVIGPQWLPLAQLRRTPGATAPPKAPRQHQVFYFGTKRQYVDYLAPRVRDASIGDTLGIYFDTQKISYFYKDEGGELEVEATLYHEVSHQLLFELSGQSGYLRNRGNYWVFEGLGTYFETVEPQPDSSILYGGRVGPRIDHARTLIVDQDRLIPTRRLVSLDRERFNGQAGEDKYLNYAEAMALAVFLMDHDEGLFRDPFLEYTSDAYRGQLRGASYRSLADRIGIEFEELDRELVRFLADRSETGGGDDVPLILGVEIEELESETLPIDPGGDDRER